MLLVLLMLMLMLLLLLILMLMLMLRRWSRGFWGRLGGQLQELPTGESSEIVHGNGRKEFLDNGAVFIQCGGEFFDMPGRRSQRSSVLGMQPSQHSEEEGKESMVCGAKAGD